jgi:hypothetical protein
MNGQSYLLFDAHVHLYPCFDIELALHSAWKNLSALTALAPYPVSAFGLALTERDDCHFFQELLGKKIFPPGISCISTDGGKSLCLTHPEFKLPLFLFPGRQFVSSEKVEILALGKDLAVPHAALPASSLCKNILDAGLTPCFPWSPGKWFGNRGKVVREMLRDFHTQQMLLGDILMRPWIFRTPTLIRFALERGYRILGGSDPLPFPGEEKNIGRMATLAIGNFSQETAGDDFLELLHYQPMIRLPEDGGRLGFFEFAWRMGKNEVVRRSLERRRSQSASSQ